MLHVTCHNATNIKLQTILPKTQCVIYFWKAHAKYSSMVMIKTLHVTCHTCYMSQISSYKQFYQRPSVSCIFGKLMQNTVQWSCWKLCMSYVLHVTCHTCYMSQMSSYKQFYQWPSVSYIFGKLMQNTVQIQFMMKTLYVICVTCHMSHILHVTNFMLQTFYQRHSVSYIFGKLI